jgi:hypothetical protein
MKRWNKHLISRRYFFCLKNSMRSRRQSFNNEEIKRSLRSSNDNDNLKRTSRMMTIVNLCSRSLYNDDDSSERWIEWLSSLCRNPELSMYSNVFDRYLIYDHYFTSSQILFFTFSSRCRQRRRQQQRHSFIMWCVSKLNFMIISLRAKSKKNYLQNSSQLHLLRKCIFFVFWSHD